MKRFETDLEKNKGLCKRLDEVARRIAEEGKAASDGEIMVAAAAELGYNISAAGLSLRDGAFVVVATFTKGPAPAPAEPPLRAVPRPSLPGDAYAPAVRA